MFETWTGLGNAANRERKQTARAAADADAAAAAAAAATDKAARKAAKRAAATSEQGGDATATTAPVPAEPPGFFDSIPQKLGGVPTIYWFLGGGLMVLTLLKPGKRR